MRLTARRSAIDRPPPPEPALTQAFAADLAACGFESGKLGLAVSGGPDSLALLLLASALIPGRIAAATVDHGLRADSAAEAEFVAQVCTALDVPHAVLRVAVGAGNLQAEARTARYAALAEWAGRDGLAAITTAHHADDQAETLLLRLNRASGVAGLAGVRARGEVPGTRVPLVRPVLGWRRSQLTDIVAAAGLTAIDDPSNADDRFDRARLRKAMARADWLDVSALAASAAYLADADAALDWATAREWSERVARSGLGLTYRPSAPRAVALRVLTQIITELDGEAPRGSAVARLFDTLVAGRAGSIGALVARPIAEGWSFTKAPARRS